MEILLSIVVQGRNDSYMGNFLWRLATCISKHAENAYALHAEHQIEIILTDWGSEIPLANVLELSDTAKSLLKVIYVSPSVAARYNQDSPYSWVHAVNTGVRRCNGKYVLFCDSDGYLSLESMQRILQGVSSGDMFGHSVLESIFLGSRYHVPKQFHEALPSRPVLDQFIRENYTTFSHDKVELPFYTGKSATYLWPKTVWEECRGLDERMIHWGWSDIDIVIRLALKYRPVDLEELSIPTYHLEHYSESRKRLDPNELPRRHNEKTMPTTYAPNAPDWGLSNELLPVIQWRVAPLVRESCSGLVSETDPLYFQLQQLARFLHYAKVVIQRNTQNDEELNHFHSLLEESQNSALSLASRFSSLKVSPSANTTLSEATQVIQSSQVILSMVFSSPKFQAAWESRNERGALD